MARRPGPPCSLGRRHALHPGVNGRGRSALPGSSTRVLHLVSWLVLAGTVAICVRLFRRSMAEGEGSTGAGQLDRVAGPVLVAAFTLTFYPVVKGFTLGQIQTWLNLALAAALSSWMAGHQARAGVLSALPCPVKPHYGLLLLWGLSRRRWRFCVAFGAVLGGAFLVSIAAFGWANHRDYLWMLAYVSAHGESFFANASA